MKTKSKKYRIDFICLERKNNIILLNEMHWILLAEDKTNNWLQMKLDDSNKENINFKCNTCKESNVKIDEIIA